MKRSHYKLRGCWRSDINDEHAIKALDLILSLGLFKQKKRVTGIEKTFEDIEKGRISFVNGTKKNRYRRSVGRRCKWQTDDNPHP